MVAKQILSDFESEQYWQQSLLESTTVSAMQQLTIYPDLEGQTFEGFGGAFTEAAGYCWEQLDETGKQEFIKAYFGQEGLRYSVGRVHINSCDFSLGNYACIESEQDWQQGEFNTERDQKYLFPLIRAAQQQADKDIPLLLSPWSPPAFMKTNGEMNNGGTLKPEFYSLWASCMARYAKEYQNAGFSVKMISVQNEPAARQTWDSCLYTAEQEAEFATKYLKPALCKEGMGEIGILIWDHNKESLLSRARQSFSVPGAQQAISGIACHWYTGDHFKALTLASRLWPQKKLWFTEGCVEYSRFGDSKGPEKARMYAHDILGNLESGIHASIDWNLLLDQAGGPNHVGNFCEAPIMLNGNGGFVKNPSYYAIGHFSRHIPAGSVRLEHSVYDSQIECTVFRCPNGSRTAVLLNHAVAQRMVNITEDGKTGYCVTLQPGQLATVCWE